MGDEPAVGRLLVAWHVGEALRAEVRDDAPGRELAVLRLLVDGLSNPRFAAELGISPNTMKFHVGNLLAKLGGGAPAGRRRRARRRAMPALAVGPLDVLDGRRRPERPCSSSSPGRRAAGALSPGRSRR